jgi:hypothetical protein
MSYGDLSRPVPDVPGVVLDAVTHHANWQAALTASVLNGWKDRLPNLHLLPRGFLLELGAIFELDYWERLGLRAQLNSDLPSYHEAKLQLTQRAARGPQEFEGPGASLLAPRVLRVWLERFAWDGPELLGAEVLVGELDEDLFAELLADFVWRHQQGLSKLLPIDHEANYG